MVSHIHTECLCYLMHVKVTQVYLTPVTVALVLVVPLTVRFFPSWPVSQSFTFTFCQWLVAVALQLSCCVRMPQVRNVYWYGVCISTYSVQVRS